MEDELAFSDRSPSVMPNEQFPLEQGSADSPPRQGLQLDNLIDSENFRTDPQRREDSAPPPPVSGAPLRRSDLHGLWQGSDLSALTRIG